MAGVQVDLIVRGICSLRPGVPGVSDNITVRSIVGRFLEHSRVFLFHAGGQDLTFISSADWMPRNMFGRVELCTPIEDPKLRERVATEAIKASLADNSQAWVLQPNGTYRRLEPGTAAPMRVQEKLLEQLRRLST